MAVNLCQGYHFGTPAKKGNVFPTAFLMKKCRNSIIGMEISSKRNRRGGHYMTS